MRHISSRRILEPDSFFWATGIEDTFITAPSPLTGRTLDEYELTQHYERWREDIELIAELRVTHARYGIPWHKINPQPNAWDWEFADKTLELLLERGVEPIVDLVHYGLPLWIDRAYLHPDFPNYMAEYAHRVAERFRGRIHLWTPLNEPRITAWYCGKLGWWPPYRRGWGGFLEVMLAACRGIVMASKVLRTADEENLIAHVDATDLYESPDAGLAGEVERRQEIVFLALDLVSGKVTPDHKLYSWLRINGVQESDLEWFQENALVLELVGINLYPLFSRKVLLRSPHLRIKMPYAEGSIIERLADLYHRRYQTPLFISETASLGSVRRRAAWLADSVNATRRARSNGVPLVGYTWWPLFALVTWAYRQGRNPPAAYLKQMGLWDLRQQDSSNLLRVRTALVDQYKKLVESGSTAVGAIQHQLLNKRS